jgi:hypothetical protein
MSIKSVDILTEAILDNNFEKVKEITDDYWGFHPILNLEMQMDGYYLLAAKLGYQDIFKQLITSEELLSPGPWKGAEEDCITVAAKTGHLCILETLFQCMRMWLGKGVKVFFKNKKDYLQTSALTPPS